MLLRIRWFVLGAVAAVAGVAYAAGQVAKAKDKITFENVARAGARAAMESLDKGLDVFAELIGTSRPHANGDGAATH